MENRSVFIVGFVIGLFVSAFICAYMWCDPAMKCEEYKQVVVEQAATIERYQIVVDCYEELTGELLEILGDRK